MSKKKTEELAETKDIKTLVNKISSATNVSEVEKYGDMLKEAMKTLKKEHTKLELFDEQYDMLKEAMKTLKKEPSSKSDKN